MNFEFFAAAGEHRRTAAGAEVATGIARRRADDGHSLSGEDGRRVKDGAVVLSAVQAMTDPDALRLAADLKTDAATKAATFRGAHAGILDAVVVTCGLEYDKDVSLFPVGKCLPPDPLAAQARHQ